MNWRGRPLSSHEAIVNSIAAATTRTGTTAAVVSILSCDLGRLRSLYLV